MTLVGLALALAACESTKTKSVSDACFETPEEISRTKQKAESGDPEAQVRVARWHEFGECLQEDFPKAVYWYQRANAQGDDSAIGRIAMLYRYRAGDMESALEWYGKWAKQGNADASRTLGTMYYLGKEIPKDLDKAEMWYRLAAEQGDNYSKRDGLANVMKEKDPVAWKREQAKLKREKRRAETEPPAKEAKARFGSILVKVKESETIKRLKGDPDSGADVTGAVSAGAEAGATGMGMVGLGPAGAAVGGGLLAIGVIFGSIEERRDRKFLIKFLKKEDVDKNLKAQLFALAEKQQASGLLQAGDSAHPTTSRYYMDVEIEEIGMFQIQGTKGVRLWLAVMTTLVDTDNKVAPVEQRICYGSSYAGVVDAWSDDKGEKLIEELVIAYHNVSNQILSGVIGLANDPDVKGMWSYTADACIKEGSSQRVEP